MVMKVHELISVLQELPQDSMVVMSGYEGGLREVEHAYSLQIKLHVNSAWYYGPHEDSSYHMSTDKEYETADAVQIG